MGGEEYDIDEVRAAWIGRVVGATTGRYPVEHDPIRRYCHMVGDENPRYLDVDEGVCPGPLLRYFAGNGQWPRASAREGGRPWFTSGVPTPGDRAINLAASWDYLHPVRVGDRLSSETRIDDVSVKAIRLDPLAVWIVTRTDIACERRGVVATLRNTILVHRAPAQMARSEGR